MKRLREQMDSRDPMVAAAAQLFAAADATEPSSSEMQRVWTALAARRRAAARPMARHLRPAIAFILFFGLIAVAWAAVGGHWAEQVIDRLIHKAPTHIPASRPNPALPSGSRPQAALPSPINVPITSPDSPVNAESQPSSQPKPTERQKSTHATPKRTRPPPEKTPLDDETAPPMNPPPTPRRVLPNEAPILR